MRCIAGVDDHYCVRNRSGCYTGCCSGCRSVVARVLGVFMGSGKGVGASGTKVAWVDGDGLDVVFARFIDRHFFDIADMPT